MLARPIALLRASRRLQAAAGVLVALALAFGWYTISPFFLTTTVVETSRAATAGNLLVRGELQRVDDLHKGSGPVVVVELEGKRYVRFENVAIQNGPDLHVYLGRGTGGAYDGTRDLYLGALKATNGTFTYEVPASANLSDYRSVIVWCRNFVTLFTWAELKAN